MLYVLRLAAKGDQRVGVAAEHIADELGLATKKGSEVQVSAAFAE
jgi:hypothetical protein